MSRRHLKCSPDRKLRQVTTYNNNIYRFHNSLLKYLSNCKVILLKFLCQMYIFKGRTKT